MMGAPPIIPGLTQLSPERMSAVMSAQEPPTPEMEADATEQLPRMIAAQFSLLQQAAELGPEAFDLLATMATTAIRQFRKQLGPAVLPSYSLAAPPLSAAPPMSPMSPGVPGERSALPFLSNMAAGGF